MHDPAIDWYAPLRDIESLGQTTNKATSLGGLAAVREQTKSQFFTPETISRLMWELIAPSLDEAQERTPDRLIKICDNSVGSGRLLAHTLPGRHALYGCDTDARCITALSEAASAAGFTYEFCAAGMEQMRVKAMDAATINPPFSLTLQSPVLEPYPCTTYGRFGPCTSTSSEDYALHQSLNAAQVVVALLPRTHALQVMSDPEMTRLRQVIHLPEDAFQSENARVLTSILVFAARPMGLRDVYEWTGVAIEAVPLGVLELYPAPATRFVVKGLEDDGPSITRAVTHEPRVRVVRNGRHIRLRYECGWMQARVENALLREHVPNSDGKAQHRYPDGVRFTGQGPLDVQQLLAQTDPVAAFRNAIVSVIRREGGEPLVDPGIEPYLRKQHRRLERQRIPLARWAFLQQGNTHSLPEEGRFDAKARHKQLLDPLVWGSPLMQPGDTLSGVANKTEQGTRYELEWKGAKAVFTAEQVTKRFEVEAIAPIGWQKVEPGRLGRYPSIETALRKRMTKLGIDRWLWEGYQQDDVIELLIGRTGTAIAWTMGLGKARCAAALCLMSQGKFSAVVSEANLVYELARELRKIGLPQSEWQIIESPKQAKELKRLNLVSYTRLRMNIDPARPKHTYAKSLRRKFHSVACDEAHALSHADTDQTRALWELSPKARWVLSGTIIGNYPRDLLPVLQWAAGEGTPLQPYGDGALNRPENVESMTFVPRGIDEFRSRFVSTEWVTAQFADGMTGGAKREIPRIADAPGYRNWIAPMVKRRVRQEPEVARHIKVEEPTIVTHQVDFDPEHLAHYLTVADSFAAWYRDMKRDCLLKGVQLNLMLILRRIQEVQFALNMPQQNREGPSIYRGGLTSKQRWVLERFGQLADEGRRILVFAQSPTTIDLFARKLSEKGHDVVALHGKIPPKQRMDAIDARFRKGSAHLLLTYKANKTGLNLPEANHVLLYEHDWAPKTEDQAIARVVRPEQKAHVIAEHIEIIGGLDDYMAQMCASKRMAAAAGLDFGEQDEREFLHLETILNRFIEDLTERTGLARDVLKKGERYAA